MWKFFSIKFSHREAFDAEKQYLDKTHFPHIKATQKAMACHGVLIGTDRAGTRATPMGKQAQDSPSLADLPILVAKHKKRPLAEYSKPMGS